MLAGFPGKTDNANALSEAPAVWEMAMITMAARKRVLKKKCVGSLNSGIVA